MLLPLETAGGTRRDRAIGAGCPPRWRWPQQPICLAATRDLALVSIGIVGVLSEDAAGYARTLYHRSLERGQGDVQGVHERLGDLGSMLPHALQPPWVARREPAASEYNSDEWRAALARLNVNSPADVDLLVAQITELQAKVDLITSSQVTSE